MSRFELSDTVSTRVRPAGRQRNRRPRVAEREAVGQVLRKHQVDAVVNRDDRLAGDERRQHVVRRVKQRDALAPQRQRNAELLGRGIVAGRFRNAPGSSRRATRHNACVGRRGRNDELGLPIEPRELPQQVADVGADAEVVQLPGVDANAHELMILGGQRAEGRGRRASGRGRTGRGRRAEGGGRRA